MHALTSTTLHRVPDQIPVPGYDREVIRGGVVHVGVGGFHRAHQAVYLDRLLSAGGSPEWGICGVGLLPGDHVMRDVLTAQDCLYSVTAKHPDGSLSPSVVGALVDYVFGPDDPEAVVERMAAEETVIVSLTITEGGYNIDPGSGGFDEHNEQVRADLVAGGTPRSVFGILVEALARRRSRGLPPFTVLSCDNIEGNGEVARRMFGAFATLRDERLGTWIEQEVPFPNSMVDRITPRTSDHDRHEVAKLLGVTDGWPVVCEPYLQWVLEDHFVHRRPRLEDAGVQLVDDVRPYELMKLRILNAGHQALGFLGYLSGHRYVDQAAADPLIERLLRRYLDHEAIPTLEPLPDSPLEAYRDSVLERFGNAHVRDSLDRICAETSDRIPKFLLPVVHTQLEQGGPVAAGALVVAAWARYAEGVDEQGQRIEVVDARREALTSAANRRDDPYAFLDVREVFGDLRDQPRFADAFAAALTSLRTQGVRATLEQLLAEG